MPAEVGHQTKIIFVIVTTAQQPLRSVCPQERCVTTRDRLAGHRRAGAAEPEPFGRPGGQTAPETEETESRRIMATPLGRASRTSSHRPALLRRGTFALLALAGSLVVTAPAQAAPSTSAEAAQLVASRGHDLEVISERFNEARVALAAQQEAATAGAAAGGAHGAAREDGTSHGRPGRRPAARPGPGAHGLHGRGTGLLPGTADQ